MLNLMAGDLTYFLHFSCQNHLLCTIGAIYQQKYPQLKVSFYECLQDDQLRVCLSLCCWHWQMNWKIGNEFAKLKKLWQRDQSEQGIEWQCETFGSSTWLRSQTQEERGDNLLTGSRNLAFSASSRTRSASCGSSDCWETRRCWTGDWRGCWRCRAASRRSWDPDWTQWTGCSPTWRWW